MTSMCRMVEKVRKEEINEAKSWDMDEEEEEYEDEDEDDEEEDGE